MLRAALTLGSSWHIGFLYAQRHHGMAPPAALQADIHAAEALEGYAARIDIVKQQFPGRDGDHRPEQGLGGTGRCFL